MDHYAYAALSPLRAGCHIARSFYRPGFALGHHDHDFAEVLLVEHGALLQLDGAGTRRLVAGDLLLLRSRHAHDLRGCRDLSGVIMNIAFPEAWLEALLQRYALTIWQTPQPELHRPGEIEIAALSRRAEALRRGPDDRLAADAFLLDLLNRLRPAAPAPWRAAPAWLAEALEALREPPLLGEGLVALARLCGRSREHISRSISQHCGQSGSSLLAALRLTHAEEELALSDRPIASIAADCGIGRARLYRLFRDRHGCSPQDYRRRCRGAAC